MPKTPGSSVSDSAGILRPPADSRMRPAGMNRGGIMPRHGGSSAELFGPDSAVLEQGERRTDRTGTGTERLWHQLRFIFRRAFRRLADPHAVGDRRVAVVFAWRHERQFCTIKVTIWDGGPMSDDLRRCTASSGGLGVPDRRTVDQIRSAARHPAQAGFAAADRQCMECCGRAEHGTAGHTRCSSSMWWRRGGRGARGTSCQLYQRSAWTCTWVCRSTLPAMPC